MRNSHHKVGYVPAQWPKELSCETKSLTCVSICALLCGAFLEIIAMCYFRESFKEEGGGGNPEVGFRRPVSFTDSATRVRPWGPMLDLPGPP